VVTAAVWHCVDAGLRVALHPGRQPDMMDGPLFPEGVRVGRSGAPAR
jgi:hypothetical protein